MFNLRIFDNASYPVLDVLFAMQYDAVKNGKRIISIYNKNGYDGFEFHVEKVPDELSSAKINWMKKVQ